jgi:hypothetical protein
MEPDQMDSLPNERYRCLLVGLYREHYTPQLMAEEMEVSLPICTISTAVHLLH